MIIVIGEATVRPDRLDTMSEALAIAVAASRKDPGCISYSFFADLDEANKVVAVERWESQEDLDGHLNTAHVRELTAALRDSLAGPPVINVYEVSSEGTFG